MRVRRIQGFTLLEVLISLLILSYALFGFDLLALRSLQSSRETYLYAIAVQQLYSMASSLQSLGPYQGFTEQITLWNQENKTVLPLGEGFVSGVYPDYRVTLTWQNQSGNKKWLMEKLRV